MSDFEDGMDLDGPGPSKDVTFSSEASKGKRSAANLPVEAEDSLPWYVDGGPAEGRGQQASDHRPLTRPIAAQG